MGTIDFPPDKTARGLGRNGGFTALGVTVFEGHDQVMIRNKHSRGEASGYVGLPKDPTTLRLLAAALVHISNEVSE